MRYSLVSDTRNWMSAIDDNKNLAHISIPGTHDSCARHGASQQSPIIDRFIATQNEECTIEKQLADGIRYLDIRCCAIEGVFTIHHGDFYLYINFGDVLLQCYSFLNENPSETILMRIKQENSNISDEEFIKIFNGKYKSYQHMMYLGTEIPNLKDVRGKIVILSNVYGLPGIPYSSINVQDDYTDTSIHTKKIKVTDMMTQSVKTNRSPHKAALFLNHCSAAQAPLMSPASFAHAFLETLIHDLKGGLGADLVDNTKNEAAHIGIIVMDFYTEAMVQEIIKRNENKDLSGGRIYSIRNEYYGKHYLFSSIYQDSTLDRRQVFGWAPGYKIINGYWMIIPVDQEKKKYFIFNTYYKEYLYASSQVDDSRRTVYTWVKGTPTRESIWVIKNGKIFNEYYGCYLFESNLSHNETRKIVPCWEPGNIVIESDWKIIFENTASMCGHVADNDALLLRIQGPCLRGCRLRRQRAACWGACCCLCAKL